MSGTNCSICPFAGGNCPVKGECPYSKDQRRCCFLINPKLVSKDENGLIVVNEQQLEITRELIRKNISRIDQRRPNCYKIPKKEKWRKKYRGKIK